MDDTITIKGRTFTVEVIPPDEAMEEGRPAYRLTGPRGASYSTFRNVPNPDLMFLVGFGKSRHGGFTPNPLGGDVWLTDKDGTLELVGRRS